MQNVPPALVTVAVEAIRHFAGDVDSKQASMLLSVWRHRGTLDGPGRLAVLAHFRRPLSPQEEVAGWFNPESQ